MMINKRLIGICKDSKKYMILAVIANMISIICNILIVILIGGFINSLYLGEKFANDLTMIKAMKDFKITDNISLFNGVICISILLIIRYSSNILYGKFSHLASANARVTLRELIYKKLLRLGPGYSNVESTAAVVQMSIEGVEQLEIYFGKYLPQFFYSMLAPITLFIFISFISLKAALVFIVCVPLIPLSIIAIMKIAKRILKAYWKNYSNLGGRFLENLQGLTTLKVFNLDEEKHEQMNSEAERFRRITMKVLSMQLNSINIMDFIAFGGAALGTIVALNQFRNGQLLAGDLLIIILLSSEFFIPLRLLGSYFHIAMNGMTASDRIFELLDSEEKEKNTKEITNELDDVSIEFEDVTFSYDGKRRVLNNINLEVNKGQLVAIVGESGSGKSTIASLILNSYSATSGKIKVNDINIENISSDDLYKKISLVSTNSYIFNGTILDNLLMGNRNAKDEEIDDALKKSRLDEFINSLKDGVNTNVGEGGNSLSGGQKQRLSLARAILADREMIIFDEATSNIDVESEEAIWKAIYELAVNKTILVISHRLANVTKADSIYVMKNGYLVEHGNHEELLSLKGEYLNMINKQNELENIRKGC